MKKSIICSLVICLANTAVSQELNGTGLLRKMYDKYHLGPCKAYTFSQRNTHYRNDSVTGHSEWYEAVEFPGKFRITFGDKNAGNKVVFKNDSVYSYRKGALAKTTADTNTLLLLLGGMFYRDFAEVCKRLELAGYDVTRLAPATWQGSDVYILGEREKGNQVWIDQKTLMVMRIIEKMPGGDQMDMRFEKHQAWCKGHVETRVSFRRNGRLEQVEEYFDLMETAGFSE